MKTLLLLFTTLFFSTAIIIPQQPTEQVNWRTDYEKALKSAKKEKKNVLVYFTGSDWCPPCKKLKTDLFDSEEFKEISKEYVLLYVDIPRNKDLLSSEQLAQNKGLVTKYNKKGVFPLLVALSKNGVVLDDYSGYSMNGEIGYHLEFLNKNK